MKYLASVLIALAVFLAPLSLSVGAPQTAQAYTGYPTFSIVSVVRNQSVTIQTYNLPAGDRFAVQMGNFGTRGVGGIRVATLNSGAGGSQTLTYNIPAGLKGYYSIAIRLQSTSGSGYYAYNWFYNNNAGSGGTVGKGGQPASGYSGYPTMYIERVRRNQNVTVRFYNLPANDEFKVTMGYMGTRGVGGIKVIALDTLTGGNQTHKFQIPSVLHGQYQIAIRIQSKTGSGYYAYNWFYNTNAN